MKRLFKFFMQLYFIGAVCAMHASATITAATMSTPGGNPSDQNGWYIDEFGPLNSNYSMGDFVRYTITPGTNTPMNPLPKFTGKGLNLFYGIADIPYAQDIYQYGINSFNLYNFVGYLFAGYASLNINSADLTKQNWLSTFRQSNQWMTGSLAFDNNPLAQYTIQLVDFEKRKIVYQPASALGWSTGSVDTGQYLSNARTREYGTSKLYDIAKANASCSWFAYDDKGSYVLAIETPGNSNVAGYAAPYGQMFGARLAHILGAVVNDVPKSSNVVTMMPSNVNSPVPQLAIMNGGPYATAAAAPAGMTTPSTAHFGTMQNYLTDLASNIASGLKNSQTYGYLQNHLLPTVTRLATLCSYAISSSSTPSQNNLIQINSENVTAYDNGVILGIQNNTGDELNVHQVTTAGKNLIGQLKRGKNNHFLHTASLMDGVTAVAAGAIVEPLTTNMIEIQDVPGKASVYLQMLNGDQVQAMVTALQAANSTLSYNQGSSATPTCTQSTAQCLVLTNYDPSQPIDPTLSVMYRIQAINVAEFNGKPYFVTLQINKEEQGYGYSQSQMTMTQGTVNTAMLYPSIVSVKTCLWANPYDRARGADFYSSIPLLLIPDSVMGAGIAGLEAHYGIWLMSYVCALTEFEMHCVFGDTTDCLQKTFKLFDNVDENRPSRVVIDAAGVLTSGATLPILSKTRSVVLMGSDVWDVGSYTNQDIPVVNLYQNGTNIVANQANGDFINFAVNFEDSVLEKRKNPQTFADAYGAPYENLMLFSLSTADVQDGLTGILSQSISKKYQLMLSQYQTEKQIYQQAMQLIAAANSVNAQTPNSVSVPTMDQAVEIITTNTQVLAVQKNAINKNGKMPTIIFNFLNNQDVAWKSMARVPNNIIAKAIIGNNVIFHLKISTGTVNNFIIEPTKKLKKKNRK
ncbi:hypothetical protein KBB68_02300 [Candidatus Babeliales bacterium]|nr:hypothetical protein [Candidatus Babeliales bacterium]